MKLLQSLWNSIVRRYHRLRYTKPLIVFIFFLVLCAALAVIFEAHRNNGQFRNFLDGFWWVIITASTTGYGDKVPITVGGRIIAIVIILAGIASMSLLSGGLASWFIDRNTLARRGLVDYSKMKDHLIICGWKQDMHDILHDIVRSAPDTADKIVVISNVEVDAFEQIKEDDVLRDVKFVRGDYFSAASLRRAGLTWARKVLVLADSAESTGSTEIDSRTVLTVLTVKSIAREVYVVAELLDKNFESYLQYVHCDEILFSRRVARKMLANASGFDGMSHILHALIAQDGRGTRIETAAVPKEYIGQTYADFRAYIENENGKRQMLLGFLENTGNPARLKIESLRQAQKTSDVSQLVTNLQKVKGIEINKPIIFPEDTHEIAHNTRAVVLVGEDALPLVGGA